MAGVPPGWTSLHAPRSEIARHLLHSVREPTTQPNLSRLAVPNSLVTPRLLTLVKVLLSATTHGVLPLVLRHWEHTVANSGRHTVTVPLFLSNRPNPPPESLPTILPPWRRYSLKSNYPWQLSILRSIRQRSLLLPDLLCTSPVRLT